MRRPALFLVTAAALVAQTQTNLVNLSGDLQAAVAAGDWKKAAELSTSLKIAAAHARDASVTQTNRDQADIILNWLPDRKSVV